MSFWKYVFSPSSLYEVGQDMKTSIDNGANAESVSTTAKNEVEKPSYIDKVVDPTQVIMDYNSAEALAQRRWNEEQSAIQRQYNSQEAEKQRQWAENLSNSAYQRSVEDMRKAGLNPYLAYGNGGASTPSGSSASASLASGASASTNSADTSKFALGLATSALDLIGDLLPKNVISTVIKGK